MVTDHTSSRAPWCSRLWAGHAPAGGLDGECRCNQNPVSAQRLSHLVARTLFETGLIILVAPRAVGGLAVRNNTDQPGALPGRLSRPAKLL